MDAEQLETDLREFHRRVADMETIYDTLSNSMGINPDSAFSNAIWGLIGGYLAALEAAYPGVGGWLEWWWTECDLGAHTLEAAPDGGELRTIATIDDLIRLVLDDLAHAEAAHG